MKSDKTPRAPVLFSVKYIADIEITEICHGTGGQVRTNLIRLTICHTSQVSAHEKPHTLAVEQLGDQCV